MTRTAIATGLLAMLLILPGCGPAKNPPIANQADVAGTVNLDGKPMDGGDAEIAFSVPGQAPIRLPIKGGKFEGKAPIGETKVEIRAYRVGERAMMDGKPIGEPVKETTVAEQFNDKTTLSAKIEAAGTKNLKFDVESKK